MSDRIFALICLGACVLVGAQMWTLDVPFAYEPVGPKVFPAILAILMAACCAVLLARPDHHIEWPALPVLAKGLALVSVLVMYASLFELLGFPVATTAMVLVVSMIYGGRAIPGLLAGASIGAVGYLVFDRLLQVSLPLGRIWS